MAKLYRDFSLNFYPNPATGDVSVVSDERAISQSLRNIVMTDNYEVPFDPDFGGNIRQLLFDLDTPFVIHGAKEDIKSAIENYEPRVTLIDVIVKSRDNGIDVSIIYRARTSTENLTVSFFIKRVN